MGELKLETMMDPEYEKFISVANDFVVNWITDRTDVHRAVDLGAHVGMYAMKLGRACISTLAVEPCPWTFRYLLNNIRANRLEPMVQPLQCAATAKTGGFVRLRLNQNSLETVSPWLNSLCDFGGFAPAINVNDLLELHPPDFLKIDIEGMEHEVVPAIRPELLHKIRYIYLEIHDLNDGTGHFEPGHEDLDLFGLLKSEGFQRLTLFSNTDENGKTVEQEGIWGNGRFL